MQLNHIALVCSSENNSDKPYKGFLGLEKKKSKVKLPATRGGASRKGNYLFQIASLNPALKGGDCREANLSTSYSSAAPS